MRVLVVQENREDALHQHRVLTAAGHHVEIVGATEPAFQRVVAAAPDVVIVDWTVGTASGNELVKRLRGEKPKGTQYLYIVMVTAHASPLELAEAYEAGVDDFIRKPTSSEELLARVSGADRLRKFLHAMAAGMARTDSEMAKLIERLPAWKSVDSIVCRELIAMLNIELGHSSCATVTPGASGATLRLSLPSERLDVRFTLFAASPTLATIGTALFDQPPSAEEARDLLFEMVNTAAGAFKRELADASIELTTGLPTDCKLTDIDEAAEGAVRRGVISGPGVEIQFFVKVTPQANDLVPATQLREGMVVVRSVCNEAGALLVPAGTRITSTTAERVAKLLGEGSMVEVSPAA